MPEGRLQKTRQNYCEHYVMKVEGSFGIAQVCIYCGKTVYVDKINQ